MMQYSCPPRAWTLKGSYTLGCINSKHSLALTSVAIKDLLIILPFIQYSQTKRFFGTNEYDVLDLTRLN